MKLVHMEQWRRISPGGNALPSLTFADPERKDVCISRQKTALGPLGTSPGDPRSRLPPAELGYPVTADDWHSEEVATLWAVHRALSGRTSPPGTVGLSSLPGPSPSQPQGLLLRPLAVQSPARMQSLRDAGRSGTARAPRPPWSLLDGHRPPQLSSPVVQSPNYPCCFHARDRDQRWARCGQWHPKTGPPQPVCFCSHSRFLMERLPQI